MNINFFWKGNNFDKWCELCILSHIKVGHQVIIWLSGKEPNTIEWFNIKNKITINDANKIFNVNDFINNGGNNQTASALWRFHFLYDIGGWYCDTDAYAIQHFPDIKWAIGSAEDKNLLSIGVMKLPTKHPILLKCIDKIQYNWGNVKVFTEAWKEYFNNINPTVPNEMFYPWTWKEWNNIYKKISINDLINQKVYSIHLYHTMLKRNNIKCKKVIKPCLINELIDYAKIL